MLNRPAEVVSKGEFFVIVNGVKRPVLLFSVDCFVVPPCNGG